MEASTITSPGAPSGLRGRASAAVFRRAWLRGVLLLTAPGAWFVLIYLAALVILFLSAFWSVNSFTGQLEHTWTLQNFKTLVDDPTYRTIALRRRGGAMRTAKNANGSARIASVTVTAAAIPIVRNAIVRYTGTFTSVSKLPSVQWWISLPVNGSTVHSAEMNSTTSAAR